ncbi:hypothetical protein CONCODRAFT_69741 [Conidiobolus coronatus NRRL 28638]|uniref:Uncharacterized protein n=1 Tax=Conidiobolus coronatus (strain ATCC 28846 / CBS 209.66 / NRRL 28638) TaxID=796925 RepID=A0A137P988_CONC2|nr:hypothetical protein CONCODRAFT_69741 [Conidiobolus coronatus NRRL 28638]|eukprot:KXN71578.1 hypothetical protein CONCODRAFT_69741 [Conidiobolus coronatus NRRL 28638]
MSTNDDYSNTQDSISKKLYKIKATLNELMNEENVYGMLLSREEVRIIGANSKIVNKLSWTEISKHAKKKRRLAVNENKTPEEDEVCENEDWKMRKICVTSIIPVELYILKNDQNIEFYSSHSGSISTSSARLNCKDNSSTNSSSDSTSSSSESPSDTDTKAPQSSCTSTRSSTPIGLDFKQRAFDNYSKPDDPHTVHVISSDDNESVKLSLSPITISSTSPLSSKSDGSLLYQKIESVMAGYSSDRQERRVEMLNKLVSILSDAFKKKSNGRVACEILTISCSNINEAAKLYCEMLQTWLKKLGINKNPSTYGNFLLLLYKIGEFQIKNKCEAIMDNYLNNCEKASVLTRYRKFSRFAYIIWEPINEQILLNVEYFSPYWFDELNIDSVYKWKEQLHKKIGI